MASPTDPFLASPRFSPDGKVLAFVAGPGFLAYDIYLVPVSGGEPKRLTFDKQFIQGLAWTPDGKGIIFASDRGGLIACGEFRCQAERRSLWARRAKTLISPHFLAGAIAWPTFMKE